MKTSSPGASQKVAVHQLDERASASEGIADSGSGDRGFGDGRVEQPVVGQRLGQSLIDRERAAPVAVLLAVGDERRVFVEAVGDGFEQGVLHADTARVGNGIAARVQTGTGLSRELDRARILGKRVRHFRFACWVHRFDMPIREHRPL